MVWYKSIKIASLCLVWSGPRLASWPWSGCRLGPGFGLWFGPWAAVECYCIWHTTAIALNYKGIKKWCFT